MPKRPRAAKPNLFHAKLGGGTRTSLGRTNAVVAEVLAAPPKFPALLACLARIDDEDGDKSAGNAILLMRASDAIEKISRATLNSNRQSCRCSKNSRKSVPRRCVLAAASF